MNDKIDFEALGRRAINCAKWKWLAGMRYTTDRWIRLDDADGYDRVIDQPERAVYADWVNPNRYPDLRDPATIGCVLHLVREAWGDEEAYACNYNGYDSVTWAVTSPLWDHKRNEEVQQPWFSCMIGQGRSEAEALVNALEEAP